MESEDRQGVAGRSLYVDVPILSLPGEGGADGPPTGISSLRFCDRCRAERFCTGFRSTDSLVWTEESLTVEVDKVCRVFGTPDLSFPRNLR